MTLLKNVIFILLLFELNKLKCKNFHFYYNGSFKLTINLIFILYIVYAMYYINKV